MLYPVAPIVGLYPHPSGNSGITPPWLLDPITILPMPDDWVAPVPTDEFHILPIED